MKYIIIVIFMAVVTYMPRLIPLVFLNNKELPYLWRRFLKFVPFAALSALIFPDILYSTGDVRSALIGSVVSILLSLLDLNVVFVVFGGIVAVLICYFI